MIKSILFNKKRYSVEEMVTGVTNHDNRMAYELERYCYNYFEEHYKAIFFSSDEMRMEIFQNSFIKLWENIEKRKLYVKDNVLMGADNQPLTGAITTYFMSIAKFKYLEYARGTKRTKNIEEEEKIGHLTKGERDESFFESLYDKSTTDMEEIIADCIANMSERCSQILSKFYYEEKNLDIIMEELPSITNKNTLKTMKYKCMETLRTNAQNIYDRYINI